jgi:hypothetical protein
MERPCELDYPSPQPARAELAGKLTIGDGIGPCYNFLSPEPVYVEADPVMSSAGGIRNPENQRNFKLLTTR